MIAQNCIAPGFTTILYSLTNSISKKTIGDLESSDDGIWMKEYFEGALMEIYEVKLDVQYAGQRFSDAVVAIYKHQCAVAFAIGIRLGLTLRLPGC